MSVIGDTLALLATVLLGLMAGALLTEGAVLVPFWRSLQPGEFLSWYRRHGAILPRFYGPLEVAAALCAIGAGVLNWFGGSACRYLLAVAALLAVAVLAVFPLYFKAANASFTAATIPVERVPEGLRRWSAWHWARTLIAIAAFIAALAAPRFAATSPGL